MTYEVMVTLCLWYYGWAFWLFSEFHEVTHVSRKGHRFSFIAYAASTHTWVDDDVDDTNYYFDNAKIEKVKWINVRLDIWLSPILFFFFTFMKTKYADLELMDLIFGALIPSLCMYILHLVVSFVLRLRRVCLWEVVYAQALKEETKVETKVEKPEMEKETV